MNGNQVCRDCAWLGAPGRHQIARDPSPSPVSCEEETSNKQSTNLLCVCLSQTKKRKDKKIFLCVVQQHKQSQEIHTTMPPIPFRFCRLLLRRQNAATICHLELLPQRLKKLCSIFYQKNELKFHGGLDMKRPATHARSRRRPGQERPIGKSRVGSFRFSMCSHGPCKKNWHRSSFQMSGGYRSALFLGAVAQKFTELGSAPAQASVAGP